MVCQAARWCTNINLEFKGWNWSHVQNRMRKKKKTEFHYRCFVCERVSVCVCVWDKTVPVWSRRVSVWSDEQTAGTENSHLFLFIIPTHPQSFALRLSSDPPLVVRIRHHVTTCLSTPRSRRFNQTKKVWGGLPPTPPKSDLPSKLPGTHDQLPACVFYDADNQWGWNRESLNM